jgi:hypothetical protein
MTDPNNLSSFSRIIDSHKYIFENGNIVLRKYTHNKIKFLKPILQSVFRSSNFITMDLETRLINNIMVPYAVGIYDGNEAFSFYSTDFLNPEKMMENAIEHLMKRKYHNYKVYLHNLSNFDGIFLLRILSSFSEKVNIIIREGRILDIKFKFGSNNYTLYFRDSYLLLPSSLRKLAVNFNVENKGLFPYDFVKEQNLDYVGSVPNINYFDDSVTKEQYLEYFESFYNSN